MKKIYSLNKGWKFKKNSEVKKVELEDYFNMFSSDTKTGIRSDYLGDSWYDNAWETVTLPHDWSIYDAPVPCRDSAQGNRPVGEVVYRKSFTLDSSEENKRVFLKFDAIAVKSKIYVNGILVAREENGYTPVFVEITPFIEPGKQIVIAVVADNRIKEGWWYEGGGIYGNTYLITAEKSMLANDSVFVCPKRSEDGAWEIEATAEIDGEYKNLQIEYRIDELDFYAKTSFSSPKESITARVKKSPRLWSINEPNLYTIKCTLLDGAAPIDEEQISIGFRELTFDAENGCRLNGEQIKLKGVCLHHDHAGVGVAVPYELHKYRLTKLKEMGTNAIRTSHNPQLKEFYRACDELGILVMNETRHFSATEEVLGQLRKFVRRDRNHPCVIMWSLFNEEPLQCTKIGKKMAEKMKEVVMSEDSSRPITGGMNGPLEPEGVVGVVDIMGFNYLQYGYEPFHEVYPDMPIIGSETGSYLTTRHTAHTDVQTGERCSFEKVLGGNANLCQWSATPGDTWRNIEDKSYAMGGFYWTGIDYRGECGEYPRIVSSFGAMDLCCFPKECFHMHKAVWCEESFVDIVYYTNYKKQGDVLINCYSNCEKIRLYVDNKPCGEYEISRYEPLQNYIEDFSGSEIRAEGVSGKAVMCENRETLPITPYQISVETSKSKLLSDCEDICVVNVYLTGAEGGLVQTGDNEVIFEVLGGGEVIGVGNGCVTDITPDKANKKRLHKGCMQAIIRSNGIQEDTKIKIVCDGIGEKCLTLECEKAEEPEYIKSESGRLSVLSWRASDVHPEYPHDHIGDLMFCWIPTTVGYGKNLMYSGKHGFSAVGGKITVPKIEDNKKAELVFEEIQGNFDIYINQELVLSENNKADIHIPINTEKYADGTVVTVVFKLDGEDCGICGKAYVRVV